ncbi:DUF885 domain-containing protein [Umboniibacter marinipuniceus]|uniref:Uncharacterized protein (DUF885 family) n=1 Tax=Umboniibacter marinipuniceus TaxID=569599 RepID=A0A3M0AE79_9GAMM|nr:DUF885 domain-containing protein [Umboniibacter marinipuniceus]RMA82444.1 uncharacterized protein (DUF885 family) [Umboniibacter marinipuniceus]
MKKTILSAVIAAALVGCGNDATVQQSNHSEAGQAQATDMINTPDAAFLQLVDDQFMAMVALSPEFQTSLGIKDNYGKWDEISEAADARALALTQSSLQQLEALDPSLLNEQNQLSLRMAIAQLTQQLERNRWRNHGYPVNQMYGVHSKVPSFLINQHRVTSVSDAEAYIERLNGVPTLFEQLEADMKARQELGVMPPAFVYPMVLQDSRNIIVGAPFDDGEASALLADFTGKVDALDIDDSQKQTLIANATTALVEHVGPAYEQLIEVLEAQAAVATTDDGAWKLPQGDEYYASQLQMMTTTDLSADEIHNIGLEEVARIHGEMRDIMAQVGFEGDLQEFFEFMRTDPQFYYPTSPEGKQRYLDEATALIDTMRAQLDDYFGIQPKAALEVKAVEAFREQSAGKAFYSRPAPDGSRPGVYYANLYDMNSMPTYQMEALAYHEGVPGHHMQLAIAQELDELPKFRRFGSYTAYIEGWGLYSELLPKEMGYYQDPYSDFGRLAMELWRACRLVVDTGMHEKRWTREEAIEYLQVNTPNPDGDIVKAIERYIVMPGQATAYKIGMIKIVELREAAKIELGDKFDIRGFHDTVLGSGAVPLDILEENVNAWVESQR